MSKTSVKKPKETRAILKPLPPQKRQQAEALSGMSMHDVGVHYNSDLPNQVGCHALTYGNQICLAPSMEKHMDHELGHVIQQKQGKVKPQVGNWNLSRSLEKGADQLGSKLSSSVHTPMRLNTGNSFKGVLQGLAFTDIPEASEFILQEHAAQLEKDYGRSELIISFRKTGRDSLERMRNGSGHKGHEILEKSIKDKTIANIPPHQKKIGIERLRGLIGVWNKDNSVEGVYLSQRGERILTSPTYVKIQSLRKLFDHNEDLINYFSALKVFYNKTKSPYVKVPKIIEPHINPVRDQMQMLGHAAASPLFLTGDYDVHDIGEMKNTGYDNIPYGDDVKVLSNINSALEGRYQDIEKNDMAWFRHGAQRNYLSYMTNVEFHEELAPGVLKYDPELLFYNPSFTGPIRYRNWYHVGSIKRLQDYYYTINAPMPPYGNEGTFNDMIRRNMVGIRKADIKSKRNEDRLNIVEPFLKTEYDEVNNTKRRVQEKHEAYEREFQTQTSLKIQEPLYLQYGQLPPADFHGTSQDFAKLLNFVSKGVAMRELTESVEEQKAPKDTKKYDPDILNYGKIKQDNRLYSPPFFQFYRLPHPIRRPYRY